LAKELYRNIWLRLPTALLIAASIVIILFIQSIMLLVLVMLMACALLLIEWGKLSDTKMDLLQIMFCITSMVCMLYFESIFISAFLYLAMSFWLIYSFFLITQNSLSLKMITFNNNYLGIFLMLSFLFSIIALVTYVDFLGINNFFILFLLIFITALIDVAAYLIGNLIGKTPLFPKISPNKTLEGLLGGIAAALIFLAVIYHYSLISQILLMLLVLVIPFSFVGDCLESQLKRTHGIKDSGALLPGHGGIWDRLDSHMAVIPIFAALSFLLI